MRAIVLVGGAGTRLRPLTHRTPKQLVPVLNRPLLEHLLLHLRSHGIESVTLAMTHTAGNEAIRAVFGDGDNLDMTIAYAYETTPLGSGGAIAGTALAWTDRDEAFFVLNGDVITDLDLTAMAASHRARGAELSIALEEVDDPSPFGVVVQDANGRISRFIEKPPRETAPSRTINAGAWLFEPSLLADMDATRPNRVEEELFPALAAAGRGIYGFRGSSYWSDVGSPAAYLAVNLDLLRGAVPERLPAGWPADGELTAGSTIEPGATLTGPVLLGRGCIVRSAARVEGPVSAGPDCTIGAGATVGGSVLWDGVTVGEGAVVRRSVLASGARVEAGAVLEDAVLAHGATVGAGARTPLGTRLEPDARYVAAGA